MKGIRTFFQKTQMPMGNRDSSLKCCTQSLTHSRTQGRDLSHIYLLILESLLDRRQLELTLGIAILVGVIYWKLFYHTDTDGGKCHFANPLSSLLALRAFPTY